MRIDRHRIKTALRHPVRGLTKLIPNRHNPFVVATVIDKCNFRCRMCDYGADNPHGSLIKNFSPQGRALSVSDWEAVARAYAPCRFYMVGAEPTVHPEFEELAIRISDIPGITLMIGSNGWLFPRYRELLRDRFGQIKLSIDGWRDTHDWVRRRPGSYDRAIESIRYLAGYDKDIRVTMVVMPANIYEIEFFSRHLLNLGVKQMLYQHLNYIAVPGYESCRGEISPEDMDTDALWQIMQRHNPRQVRWSPAFTTKREVELWYKEQPSRNVNIGTICKYFRRLRDFGTVVIGPDGRLEYNCRCWMSRDLGNAMNPEDRKRFAKHPVFVQDCKDQKKFGIPPQCQRLCCDGGYSVRAEAYQ